MLEDAYEGFIKTKDTWARKIYLAKHGGGKITAKQHPNFGSFLADYQGVSQPPPYTFDPIPEEIDVKAEAGTTKKQRGKGYSGGIYLIGNSSVTISSVIYHGQKYLFGGSELEITLRK